MSDDPAEEQPPGRVDPVALAAQLRILGETMITGWRAFANSPAGQQLLGLADYYQDHPDELDELIRAREAEATRVLCHCLCGRWKHLGTCTSYAVTERMFGPVTVPLCAPCAGSIDGQRTPEAARALPAGQPPPPTAV